MKSALVADIQRTSINDGPGIRTTVFFKGCPLSCKWCHNPECISTKPEIMFYPEKCIHCGKCKEGCYTGARVLCGKSMTTAEVLDQIMLDYDYYGEDGGVTFSGGEPMMQDDFLKEIIPMCKEKGVHTAIETSLIIYDEEIFKSLDIIMADLKIWDSATHKEYTGVANEKIKEHFIMLDKLGVPIIARTPYIPEVNQEFDKISEFLKELKNVIKYEILPYHPLGVSKQKALGKKETRFTVPSKKQMEEVLKYAYIR
ncbi:MAG: glycyl-radical enzyme activating protein [Clostridia bacterium]|nr:glycyl-radical enzyme activating protein [Clostridia bacterium]